ncbi:MAG: single-stranded DNA-binding protein [Acidimicrobiales bacterium]
MPISARSVSPSTSVTSGSVATRSVTSRSVTSRSAKEVTEVLPIGTNLVILRGCIRRDPEFRVLPSGDEALSLDLTIQGRDMPNESVPVVWHNPTAAAASLAEGDEIVVIGRIRRRFFRTGGATSSRTEVIAERVVSARAAARIRTLLVPRLEAINLE